MSLREECGIVRGGLVSLWAILWLSVGVIVWGVESQWWSSMTASEALTRIVLMWGVLMIAVMVWAGWRRLLRWYDIPAYLLMPLIAPSIATLLELSVPVDKTI